MSKITLSKEDEIETKHYYEVDIPIIEIFF